MIIGINETNSLGSGYFKDTIDKFLKRTEVTPVTEEAIFQKKLEDERKRIQRIVSARGRIIEHNEPRGYNPNERLTGRYESGTLGKRIDILV